MSKSPEAFRTISEVAEALETPAHVLRFWESRFPQIRPVKRAGGRRYYRPADVALLAGIKHLLHEMGMTIRGVQKLLREEGVRHVIALGGQGLPSEADTIDDAESALEFALAESFGLPEAEVVEPVQPETATIIALETALRRVPGSAAAPAAPVPAPEAGPATAPEADPAADPAAFAHEAAPDLAEPPAGGDEWLDPVDAPDAAEVSYDPPGDWSLPADDGQPLQSDPAEDEEEWLTRQEEIAEEPDDLFAILDTAPLPVEPDEAGYSERLSAVLLRLRGRGQVPFARDVRELSALVHRLRTLERALADNRPLRRN